LCRDDAHPIFGSAEFDFGLGPIGRDLLVVDSGFAIKNGAAAVPQSPGLGIVLDEKVLDRHTLKKVVVGDR
jgi:muconate cycloisomerase